MDVDHDGESPSRRRSGASGGRSLTLRTTGSNSSPTFNDSNAPHTSFGAAPSFAPPQVWSSQTGSSFSPNPSRNSS